MNNLFTALLFLMWFFSHVATGKRTRKPLEIDEAIPSRTSGRLTLTTARWFDPVAKSARKWISKAKELLRWVLGYGPLSVPSAQVIRQSYQEFHNQVVDTQTYEGLEEYLVKLGRIAHFSRLFKRYGRDTEEREGFMYRRFPDPIPRKLHKELQANCTQSIFHCIETANHYIKSSRWFSWYFFSNHYYWDSAVHDPLGMWRRVTREDFVTHTDPFLLQYDRFIFAVTLSYYFCWFTMLRLPILQHLPYCRHTNKIHSAFIVDNKFDESLAHEVNAEPTIDVLDEVPFRCAQYSFCPNPCCRQTDVIEPKCSSDPSNPCRVLVDKTCELEGHRNSDFVALVQNQFNISCHCGPGQHFNVQHKICVDIDECAEETYYCPQPNTVCVNTIGSFTCACRLGYVQKVEGLTKYCEEITKPLHYREVKTQE